jgi:hypothetical protein
MAFIFKEKRYADGTRNGILFDNGIKLMSYKVNGTELTVTGMFRGTAPGDNGFIHGEDKFYWDTNGHWDGANMFIHYDKNYNGIQLDSIFNPLGISIMIIKCHKTIGFVSFGKRENGEPFIYYTGIGRMDDYIEVSTETLAWRLKMDRV